jgi:hypothetical protein
MGADPSPVAAAASSVKNVVLVHGAFADGSSWAKVIPLLEALAFGAAAIAALGIAASQLPPVTLQRLGLKFWPRNQWLLNKAQRFDDDVAELVYSPNRLVPTQHPP